MPRRGLKNYKEGGKTTAEIMRAARAEKCKFSPIEKAGLATYEKHAFTTENLLALDMPASIAGGNDRKIILYRFTDAEVKTLGKKAFQIQPDEDGKLVFRWNCTNYEKSVVHNTKKADVVRVWNAAEFEKAYDEWAAANAQKPRTAANFWKLFCFMRIRLNGGRTATLSIKHLTDILRESPFK